MNIKTLTATEDLEKFRSTAAEYIDVLLPLEYLQRSKVVVCTTCDGSYCGGYMIVQKGPLRVLNSIPKEDYAKLTVNLDNVAEITGLWLDSTKTRSCFCSTAFWLKLYFDMAVSGYSGFVYAYTMKKKNLAKIYSTFKPTTLFRGETKQLEGMDNAEIEVVEHVNKLKVVFAPILHFNFLTRRINLGTKRAWRRGCSSSYATRILSSLSFFKTMLTGATSR